MILEQLTAENFRNLDSASVDFHPAVNIIVGRNGQGKTNLIEALYFVATTKSFRTSRIASVCWRRSAASRSWPTSARAPCD
ncbi:MAG: AAA family ATPase, partial [Thermoanaerobaculia bacterium]